METLEQLRRNMSRAWKEAVWGEELIADLGSVSHTSNPARARTIQLKFELVRVGGKSYLKYSPRYFGSEPAYIELGEISTLQSILDTALREATAAARQEHEAGDHARKPPVLSRRRFVLEAVLSGLVGGSFGAGLLLAFGSQALAIWGLMAVAGLLTGVLIAPVWQKFVSASGDIAVPADLRWNKLFVVTGGTVVGALISIALAGEFWTPFEAAARSLIALMGPVETGIVFGTTTWVFPAGLLRMLRGTNTPPVVRGTLAGISSGVEIGMAAAIVIGLIAHATEYTITWGIVGGLIGLNILLEFLARASHELRE